MDVHKGDETFQFDKLKLTSPNGIVGGSYLTKYSYNGNKAPLYIQTNKTRSKQGIVVANKKAYIDILITNDDSDFIDWIANLEKYSIDLLFEKRNLWFTEELDKHDIENSFTPPIRPFKSGQSYLVRVNLELNRISPHNQAFLCKVFDENRRISPVEYVTSDHQIISIIEFQGIKFTKRNFQIELILRQVLVVPDLPLFETCIISPPNVPQNNNYSAHQSQYENSEVVECGTNKQMSNNVNNNENNNDNENGDNSITYETADLIKRAEYLGEDTLNIVCRDERTISDAILNCSEPADRDLVGYDNGSLKHFELTEVDIDFNNIPNTIDVEQPTFNLDSNNIDDNKTPALTTSQSSNSSGVTQNKRESSNAWKNMNETNNNSVTLKKHKDVLYEMYKTAKRKAQDAKKIAIRAYLEAKEIKAAYMLDDLEDSESNSDSDSDSDLGMKIGRGSGSKSNSTIHKKISQ
jgi:hypothetical protein